MAHNYLFKTHHFIKDQLAALGSGHPPPEGKTEDILFTEGRLRALKEFQEYLAKNLDPKLPKKLKNKLPA